MCHFGFDAWSDATETDTNDGRLDSGSDGVKLVKSGTVIFEKRIERKYFFEKMGENDYL